MKVELLVTLKGKNRWKKGLILDSEEAPIPSEILAEIKQNKRTVKVLKEDPSPKPAPPDYERNEWDSEPPLSDGASDNVNLTVENPLLSKCESDNAEAAPETVAEITEEVVSSFDSVVASVTTDLLSESNPEELPVNDDIDQTGTSTDTTENQDPTETTTEKQDTEESAETDLECDICHRPFSSPKGLKTHKTKMHKEQK